MKQTVNIGKWIAGLAIAALVVSLLWYFRSTVVYIMISGVLAIVGRPIVRILSNVKIGKFLIPRWLSALITLLLMWIVLIGVCLIIVPLVSGKIASLASLDWPAVLANIQTPLEKIQLYLESLYLMPQNQPSLTEVIVGWLRKIIDYDTINAAFSSVVDVTLSIAIAFFSISFITFFFLKEDGLFYKMVAALFPVRYKDNVLRALDKITVLLSRYFVGLLTESTILMVVISIILLIFGVDVENACFIGIIMGVMNVIPYAGPLMGGVISVFMGLVTPIEGYTIGYTSAVIVGTLLTVKGIDDFVLQPTLYSERVNAHPLEVFIVILMAGSAGGILGMLLAIPSYTVLRDRKSVV